MILKLLLDIVFQKDEKFIKI